MHTAVQRVQDNVRRSCPLLCQQRVSVQVRTKQLKNFVSQNLTHSTRSAAGDTAKFDVAQKDRQQIFGTSAVCFFRAGEKSVKKRLFYIDENLF